MEASKLNRAKRRMRIKRVEEVVEDEGGRKRKGRGKNQEEGGGERERERELFDNLIPMDRVTNGLKHHAIVDDDNIIKS